MTPAGHRPPRSVWRSGFTRCLLAFGVVLAAVLPLPMLGSAGTAGASPLSKPPMAQAGTGANLRCGIKTATAHYHGTNAQRALQQAQVNPLKVANYPCPFPQSLRGIRLDLGQVSLVAGGKLVRTFRVNLTKPMTLPVLTRMIHNPAWIAETAPGVFELHASLIQEQDTTLDISAPAVRTVHLDDGQALLIGGSNATVNFTGVTVSSWLPAKHTPLAAPMAGRPFVVYKGTGKLNVTRSTMEYLGSDTTWAYGVDWREGASGAVDHSVFQHSFFGAYTFQASHISFEHSTFRYNTFYGLDPHTNSRFLTITDNDVYGNGDHGIVFSRYVTNSVVTGNDVHGNKVNGIMMDFQSDHNVIAHNKVTGNAEGIVLSGSGKDNVYGNVVSANTVGIRASHQGADADNVHDNTITGGKIGIQLYGGATATRLTDNVIRRPGTYGMVLQSPRSQVQGDRISQAPVGIKVLTASSVANGDIAASKVGIEVGGDGIASVRSVPVQAPKPVAVSGGGVVTLQDTTYGISKGAGISILQIAGAGLVLFCIFCEVVHLARKKGLNRVGAALSGVSVTSESQAPRLAPLAWLTVRRPHARNASPAHGSDPPPVASGGRPPAGDGVRRFRPDIEGLRAIAVIFVVLSHASLGLPGGYIGVDVFFVISGYLITQQLLRERERSGRTSFKQFYARRARRILPIATVVIVATVVAAHFVVSPLEMPSVATDAGASALFAVNWRLAVIGTNYFNATAPPSPFQHFWSLSVEEQFYIVWPALIALLALVARRISFRWLLTGALVAVIGASLWASITVTNTSASFSYFGTHTRAWELATGALVAVWAPRLARIPARVAVPVAWASVATIFACGFLLNASSLYPGAIAEVPVYAAALLIAVGCGPAHRWGPEGILRRGPFQFTGKMSYSIYLWHWPLLILLPDYLGHAATWEERLLAIGIAFGLSVVGFVLVEQPVRANAWMVLKPTRALGTVVALASCTIVVAGVTSAASRPPAPTGPFATPQVLSAISELPPPVTKASGKAAKTSGKTAKNKAATVSPVDAAAASAVLAGTHVTTVPSDVEPPLNTAPTSFPATTQGCEAAESASAPKLPCDGFGDPKGKIKAVMIGDSHAGMWLPAVTELAKADGWNLTFMAKSGCPVGDYQNFVLPDFSKGVYTQCNSWRADVFAQIQKLKPSVVIVASQARSIAAQEPHGMTETLEKIKPNTKHLILLADVPNPVSDVPDCLAQHLNAVQNCDIPITKAGITGTGRQADIASAHAAGVPVVDPTPWFCTASVCPVVVDNTVVFMDASHITSEYAILREPQLAAAINAAVKQGKG